MFKVLFLAITIAIFGLVVLWVAIYIEDTWPSPTSFVHYLIELSKHFGGALLSIALIGILIERKDWQKYFEERLVRVVMKDEYLRDLQPDRLASLQAALLKAFFKSEDIMQEGSFLHFFEDKIRGLIGSPYREQTDALIHIEHSDSENFRYESEVCYKCRKANGRFQNEVAWAPGPNEFVEVEDVEIKIEVLPSRSINSSAADKTINLDGAKIVGGAYVLDYPSLKQHYIKSPPSSSVAESEHIILREDQSDPDCVSHSKIAGAKIQRIPVIAVPLTAFENRKDIDCIVVTVTGRCIKRKGGFIGWGMSHLTKGLNIVCRFPEDLIVRDELFGIESPDHQFSAPGLLQIRVDSWVLPFSGLALEFLPVPVHASNETECKK